MASRASRGDGGGDGKLLGRFDWHSSSRVPTDGQTDTPRIHLDRHDFTMTEETPNKISISGTLPSRTKDYRVLKYRMPRQPQIPLSLQMTYLQLSKCNETCRTAKMGPPESVQTISSQHAHDIGEISNFI